MSRYLKSAFWAGIRFHGLGKLPINALAVLAFLILGIGHPAFWLLGAGLEAAFLYYLVSNPRFRRAIDAIEDASTPALPEPGAESLPPPLRARFESLTGKIARTRELSKAAAEDDFIAEQNSEILQRLASYYFKLLRARSNIESTVEEEEEEKLARKLAGLEQEIAKGKLSGSLLDSKTATLEVLRQRLTNLARKAETLTEIESDLTRIEAQVDLALEDASMQGKPTLLSGRFDLTSQVLSDAPGLPERNPPEPQ